MPSVAAAFLPVPVGALTLASSAVDLTETVLASPKVFLPQGDTPSIPAYTAYHIVGYADARLRYILDKSSGAVSGLPDRSKPFLVLGIETSCDDVRISSRQLTFNP